MLLWAITKTIKMRLIQTIIFSIFRYMAETWTIKAAVRKRVDAFEMWCRRNMLRIPWTAWILNESILREFRTYCLPVDTNPMDRPGSKNLQHFVFISFYVNIAQNRVQWKQYILFIKGHVKVFTHIPNDFAASFYKRWALPHLHYNIMALFLYSKMNWSRLTIPCLEHGTIKLECKKVRIKMM